MAEYITKDAVISLFEKWSDGYAYIEIPVQDAIRQVSAIPPADARPVARGQWKPFDLTYGRSIYACSSCGKSTRVPTVMDKPTYRYCPKCGAWMEGGESDG